MRRIWLIGGTSDARELASALVQEGFSVLATVATDQGGKIWQEVSGLEVRAGRMDQQAMEDLLAQEPFLCAVDGSHPYAQVVSDLARRACESAGVPLLRLGRPETALVGDVRFFDDAPAVARFLESNSGPAFLTVGSKELAAFTTVDQATSRFTVRILPDLDSLAKCQALGFPMERIIAMMGPFSKAVNKAMLVDTGAKWLVTKDGGARGGVPEKLEAAAELQIPVLMIRRPQEGGPTLSQQQILDRLLAMTGGELLKEEVPAVRSRPFPVFLDLQGRKVLVVGGGPVAARRVQGLLDFGATVQLVAPEICPAMAQLLDRQGLSWDQRPWKAGDEEGVLLVLAATNDGEVNRQVLEAARKKSILANRADVHRGNDFIFPALVTSGDAVAAISTGGDDPSRSAALAKRLRDQWPHWTAETPAGRPLRVASRESELAVAQSRQAMELLDCQGIKSQLMTMKTTGDVVQDRTLDVVGGKGLFIKELQRSLLEGRADLAVHSLKDLPVQGHPDLVLAALLAREDPRDCLVTPLQPRPLLRIGTSSRRRTLQGQELFPEARFMPLRGNVLSRLAKLDRGELDGLILAVAGLQRLGLEDRIGVIFEPHEMVPSAGQGVLALECRRGSWTEELLKKLDCADTALCCRAERAFIAALDGGCSAPHGAYCYLKEGQLHLLGLYVTPQGELIRGQAQGSPQDPEGLGEGLARALRDGAGADRREDLERRGYD